MSHWNKILSAVEEKIHGDLMFFRGQPDATWPLMPGLGRLGLKNPKGKEKVLYYDFNNFSGPLLPENRNSWRTIFLMQHHGLPTRLLDWTGSFGVALYFALKGAEKNAAVWMLDPFELNNILLRIRLCCALRIWLLTTSSYLYRKIHNSMAA
jgi:hypothetical protein